MIQKRIFSILPLLVILSLLIHLYGCKKDESPKTPPITVTDIDGSVYNTVTIGKQTWMKENLKVTKYKNGDIIGTTNPSTFNIENEINPKYQWVYDADITNLDSYGRLYSWYVATDKRGVCPVGWHVPSDEEWTILINFLIANGYNYDGALTGQNEAKALATNYGWSLSSKNGAVGNIDFSEFRNKSKFSALPGGFREFTGAFKNSKDFGYWWSSNQSSEFEARYRLISFDAVHSVSNRHNKMNGLSIRCLWDN